MLAHTFTAISGKYGVSAAYAASSGEMSAKHIPSHRWSTESGCKGTNFFL